MCVYDFPHSLEDVVLNKSKSILFLLSDVLILLIVYSLTSLVLTSTGHEMTMSVMEKGLYYVLSSLMLLMFYIEGLYTMETFDPVKMPVSLIRASALALVMSTAVLAILYAISEVRYPLFLYINSLILPYLILGGRTKILQFLSQDDWSRRTVLIGSEETLQLTHSHVIDRPFLGFRINKVFKTEDFKVDALPENIDVIVIERSLLDRPLLRSSLERSGAEVIDIADFTEHVSGKIPLSSITEERLRDLSNRRNTFVYEVVKSLMDKSVALIMIIGLLPLAVVLFPLLLIIHGRPIFFKQTRTGLHNRPFTLYKLRSMVTNAEKDGARWSCPGDSRITPVGKWLRKTRIDELPQLYNILKGEMSLVGPRPERPELIEKELAPKIPLYDIRHLVRPGATGWAQVAFRYGFTAEDSKEKLQYDLFYIKNRSILLDVVIILKTIKTVLTGAGH